MRLSYVKSDAHSKHDILWIHGNLASSVWWEPAFAEWKKAGSLGRGEMIAADWRGCGKNPDWPADRPFSLEDLAGDHLELLHELGKTEVALVGHSLGGLIALQMMILDPSRITRAVLLDPVGANGVVFDDGMYEAFKQMAASRALTETVIMSTVREQKHVGPEFHQKIADDAFKAVRGIGTSVLEILKTVRLEEAAKKVRVPTLILHGRHDQIIPLKDSEDLAGLMPDAKLEVLPEGGHCWNVENPSAFVKSVRAWL